MLPTRLWLSVRVPAVTVIVPGAAMPVLLIVAVPPPAFVSVPVEIEPVMFNAPVLLNAKVPAVIEPLMLDAAVPVLVNVTVPVPAEIGPVAVNVPPLIVTVPAVIEPPMFNAAVFVNVTVPVPVETVPLIVIGAAPLLTDKEPLLTRFRVEPVLNVKPTFTAIDGVYVFTPNVNDPEVTLMAFTAVVLVAVNDPVPLIVSAPAPVVFESVPTVNEEFTVHVCAAALFVDKAPVMFVVTPNVMDPEFMVALLFTVRLPLPSIVSAPDPVFESVPTVNGEFTVHVCAAVLFVDKVPVTFVVTPSVMGPAFKVALLFTVRLPLPLIVSAPVPDVFESVPTVNEAFTVHVCAAVLLTVIVGTVNAALTVTEVAFVSIRLFVVLNVIVPPLLSANVPETVTGLLPANCNVPPLLTVTLVKLVAAVVAATLIEPPLLIVNVVIVRGVLLTKFSVPLTTAVAMLMFVAAVVPPDIVTVPPALTVSVPVILTGVLLVKVSIPLTFAFAMFVLAVVLAESLSSAPLLTVNVP